MSEQVSAPSSLDDMLTIGISTSALFDMREPQRIFEEQGIEAYRDYMLKTRDIPLPPGHAFDYIATLARLEREHGHSFASIKILSRQDQIAAARITESLNYYRLTAIAKRYGEGNSPVPYLKPFDIEWFITTNPDDAKAAMAAGIGACVVNSPLTLQKITPAFNRRGKAMRIGQELPSQCEDEALLGKPVLHTVFDLDQVVFDGDTDAYLKRVQDVNAHFTREAQNRLEPCGKGPLFVVAEKLSNFAQYFEAAGIPQVIVNTALSVRSAEAAARAIHTLNTYNLRMNGSVNLVGCGVTRDGKRAFINPSFKDPFLEQIQIHHPEHAVFFVDDSVSNVERANKVCVTGHVPGAGTVSTSDVVKPK